MLNIIVLIIDFKFFERYTFMLSRCELDERIYTTSLWHRDWKYIYLTANTAQNIDYLGWNSGFTTWNMDMKKILHSHYKASVLTLPGARGEKHDSKHYKTREHLKKGSKKCSSLRGISLSYLVIFAAPWGVVTFHLHRFRILLSRSLISCSSIIYLVNKFN